MQGATIFNNLLPDFDDPLFSIFVIFLIGFIVALIAYFLEFYKKQKNHKSMLSFLDKFESHECVLDTQSLHYEPNMLTPLLLLANSFEKNGEYHKAVSIYLYLIKNISDELPKYELMERLGDTYLGAGFLGRAESIYLDILSKHPRNTKALYSLGVVYEMMHKWDKAKEIIAPLEILGENTQTLHTFFTFEETLYDKKLSSNQKVVIFQNIIKTSPEFYRLCIEQLFKLDEKEAWEIYDPKKSHEIVDILWFLDNQKIDLQKSKDDLIASELFYIKGASTTQPKLSQRVALDMLALAKKSNYPLPTLVFSYLCKECKVVFPVASKRCPNCKSINSLIVEEELGKKTQENNNSLL